MTLWLEDLVVGERHVSPSRTLTEHDLLAFAAVSGDHHGLHTDHDVAVALGFPGRLLHGVLGLAALTGLVDSAGWFDRSVVAMLGIEDWRFTAPLLVGVRVHAEMTVVGNRPARRRGTGVVDRAFRLLTDDGVVAQQGRIPALIARRPHPSENERTVRCSEA